MLSQTFRGADVNEALEAVRAALGPDAIIESTRTIGGSNKGALGPSCVEVTATSPFPGAGRRMFPFGADEMKARIAPTPRRIDLAAPREQLGNFPSLGIQSGPPVASGLTITQLATEIQNLKEQLERLSAAQTPKDRALSMLASFGIQGKIAKQLAQGGARVARKGDAALRDWLTIRLREQLKTTSSLLTSSEPILISCVGPTGAGKTTTLAKLAARARLDLGRSVGIISLDTYRVGAVEQWQRYAYLMGIAFSVARNVTDFRRALQGQRADIVLVDTAGRHEGDSALTWPVQACLESVQDRRKETLLVLPAWLGGVEAERVVQLYRAVSPSATVFSKVDEAGSIGGVLQSTLAGDLPVAYECHGPRVPEDIRDADADAILARVIPHPS